MRLMLAAALLAASTALLSPQRVLCAPDERITLLENRQFHRELSSRIRQAKSSIHLVYFLFKITDSPGNLSTRIASELIDAARRGVQVTVVLEDGSHDDSIRRENRRTAKMLRRGGVTVIFDSPLRVTHVKAAVIDGRHVLMGSHNLTHSALTRNNELSLYVDSPTLASRILAYSAEATR